MVVFSWAVVSFCIELFCVVTLQYQILVRIAIAYFIIEKKNAVNTKKTVRKNMLLRTVCIFGQFCKLELNKIAARWPAKAVAQLSFSQ